MELRRVSFIVYVDLGTGSTDTGTINFAFSTTASTNRQWEIKVTQVPCHQDRREAGCLQYHEGTTGRIETFNFQEPTSQIHLQEQK